MGVKVIAKPNESIDSLIRRFTIKVFQSGILRDYLRKQYYLKPSELKRKKRYFRVIKRQEGKHKLDYRDMIIQQLKSNFKNGLNQ
ncbi:MAG: 30S ribosomal protein S21 [Candidatus Micrarchaeia archaeon]